MVAWACYISCLIPHSCTENSELQGLLLGAFLQPQVFLINCSYAFSLPMKFSTRAGPPLGEVAAGKEAAHDTTDTAPSAAVTGGVEMADTSVAVIKEAGPEF